MEAMKIMKVTKSLYLSGASLPEDMSAYYDCRNPQVNMWSHLANSAVDSDIEQFLFIRCFDDPEAIYELEERCGCDYHIGKLAMSAKKTGLKNIKFSNFSEFSKGVVRCICEEKSTCEEIGFKWNSATNMQEEVQDLMEKIGWKKKENPDPQYDVVIVKFRSDEWYKVWIIVLSEASEAVVYYSKIREISASGKAHDISSTFWNTLMENPQEYIVENETDTRKMLEAYINLANSFGVPLEYETMRNHLNFIRFP